MHGVWRGGDSGPKCLGPRAEALAGPAGGGHGSWQPTSPGLGT